MASTRFRIVEHTIPASYIREYPRATAGDQEAELQLAVKAYFPLTSQKSQNQITIIGGHANGLPKELYEPLWDDLHDQLLSKDVYINSIWIADWAHQGDSGVINEAKIGNDPSWMDNPRDLFLMINHFRKDMRRPLFGIGHSMGGCALVELAIMHPRLLTSLILIDPVIERAAASFPNNNPAATSMKRRDFWPSRKDAREIFLRSKFYQSWNPRVLEKWIQHGLRDSPTGDQRASVQDILPTDSSSVAKETTSVVLKTTKHQEVSTFMRQNPKLMDPASALSSDNDDLAEHTEPFYRPEPLMTFAKLPHLFPSTLYIFGGNSPFSSAQSQAAKIDATGTGKGGSGGMAKNRVASHTIHGAGHLVPFELVAETATACSSWLSRELAQWQKVEEAERMDWEAVPRQKRNQLSAEYVKAMKDWSGHGSGKTAPKTNL